MIDYMQLAQEAGFGGVLRRTMLPRIKALVDLSMQAERLSCAKLCEERGNFFSTLEHNDFHDGKMDGAYSCAELILERK
jgi:hypothetical protein